MARMLMKRHVAISMMMMRMAKWAWPMKQVLSKSNRSEVEYDRSPVKLMPTAIEIEKSDGKIPTTPQHSYHSPTRLRDQLCSSTAAVGNTHVDDLA
jgi:hypothetical protein